MQLLISFIKTQMKTVTALTDCKKWCLTCPSSHSSSNVIQILEYLFGRTNPKMTCIVTVKMLHKQIYGINKTSHKHY